ncbi:putative N-acetyltransferase YsnE [Microbacterium lemovicicum]|uniref:Putative N-acetyltransferase YsnE n=1 Tax=Microbacterium lemovicicum TaxID=1072463 RepID=A0A3S9WC27_9MICO|nr:GNAT family N-acetyltransferase [Microbacterium lemovicicum]AZS37599.1 putative N-acetyltransferase YsnE [Microbacterium lemovicicum]
MTDALDIQVADLSSPDVRELLALHLSGMHDTSPPESVHALDIEGLRHPSITVWSARIDGELAGIVALSRLGEDRGEIKSMRVPDAFLGRGVGRALLQHLVAAARTEGLTDLWLETGSTVEFAAARSLYASEGFVGCGPFGSYTDDPFSTYMTRSL